MKRRIVSMVMCLVMLTTFSFTNLFASAAVENENDYHATFSISLKRENTISQNQLTTLYKGDILTVSVSLKTDYYVSAVGIPVVYSNTLFEYLGNVSYNTSSAYINRTVHTVNADSPSSGYPSDYTAAMKEKYNYVLFNFIPDASVSQEAVSLSTATKLVSFQLRVKQTATVTSGTVMLDSLWQKTASNRNGKLFAGRYESSTVTLDSIPYGQTLDLSAASHSFTLVTSKTPADYTAFNSAYDKAVVYAYNNNQFTDGGTKFANVMREVDYNLTAREQDTVDGWTSTLNSLVNTYNGAKYFKIVDDYSYVLASSFNITQTIKSTSSSYKLKINSITAYIVNDNKYATVTFDKDTLVTSAGSTFTVKGTVSVGSPIRYTVNYDLINASGSVVCPGATGYGYNYVSTVSEMTGGSGDYIQNPSASANHTSSNYYLFAVNTQSTIDIKNVVLTTDGLIKGEKTITQSVSGTAPSTFKYAGTLEWRHGYVGGTNDVASAVKFTNPSTSGYWSFTFKLTGDASYSLPMKIYWRDTAQANAVKTAVNNYLSKNLDGNHFTSASWKAYMSALDNAQNCYRAVAAPNTSYQSACANTATAVSKLDKAYEGLVVRADYSQLNTAKDAARTFIDSVTNPDSYGDTFIALKNAYSAANSVNMQLPLSSQKTVDTATGNLAEALSNLALVGADYTSVHNAVEAYNTKVKESAYPFTSESLAAVNVIIESYDRNLTIDRQDEVEAIAAAIIEKTNALVYILADFTALHEAVDTANGLNRALYSNFELVDHAVSAADFTLTIDRQNEVNAMTRQILDAIEALEYAPADYTGVDDAIARFNGLDKSLYVDLKPAQDAVNAVVRGYTADRQADVDAMAEAIYAAIAACKYIDADYRAVDAALEEVEKLYPASYYENYAGVEIAVMSVVRNLPVVEQKKVDAMAAAILEAIAELKLLGADYTCVYDAIARIPEDLSEYTQDSINAMWNVVDHVDFTITIERQNEVENIADTIIKAFDDLVLRGADYSEVDNAIITASMIERDHYIDLSKLDAAILAVDRTKNIRQQDEVKAMATAILKEINALELKGADYTVVENAIEAAEAAVETSEYAYTEASKIALQEVINRVDYTLKITAQNEVNQMAQDILNQIEKLEYIDADYAEVDRLIDLCNKLNRDMYVDLTELDTAVAAVVWGLKIDKQSQVDKMAETISLCYEALTYKDADYTAVHYAIANYNSLIRSYYVDLTEADAAVARVQYSLKMDRQSDVDKMADDIVLAIRNLVMRPADTSKMTDAINDAISRINEMTSTGFELDTDTLDPLYDLIDQAGYYEGAAINLQPDIDALTKQITAAAANLTYKSVILKDQCKGVIFDGAFVYGIEEGEDAGNFAEQFVTLGKCHVEIEETANGFGTGSKIKLVKDDGTVVEEYTCVVFGDANGDGWADIFDTAYLIELVNVAFDEKENPALLKALDMNLDGVLDVFDVAVLTSVGNLEYSVSQDGTMTLI